MKLNKKTLVVSTATLTLAAGAAFAWGYIGEGGGSVSTVSHEPIEFRLAGPVDNIDQGETNAVEIPLDYKNPNSSDVSGMDITAEVTGTSSTECPVMLDVDGDGTPETDTFHTANGSGTTFTANTPWTGTDPGTNPTIYADDAAPDACQGVDLDIEFSLTTT
jgi:hypothetical protein